MANAQLSQSQPLNLTSNEEEPRDILQEAVVSSFEENDMTPNDDEIVQLLHSTENANLEPSPSKMPKKDGKVHFETEPAGFEGVYPQPNRSKDGDNAILYIDRFAGSGYMISSDSLMIGSHGMVFLG